MRIVIIGGSGHVGTYLVPRLVAAEHEVINISRKQREPYHAHAAWRAVQHIVTDRAAEEALDVHIKAPKLETKQYGAVPTLDVSASYDVETQEGAVFVVNRSQTESIVTDIIWQDSQAVQINESWQLAGSDPKDVNSWDAPERIVAKAIPAPAVDRDRATLNLPPLSFTVLTSCST